MNIRLATIADIPQLVALNEPVQNMHAAAFPTRFRRGVPADVVAEAFAAMLVAPSSYWLVAEEKQLVGFLSAEFRQRDETWCSLAHQSCYLASLVVAPEFQRRGIARALVGELQQEARRRGSGAIDLDVWHFNAAAREAFARLGFTPLMEKMTLVATDPKM